MTESNPNTRLEAFCDGVFAIALTLLIIDIKIPSSAKIETTDDLWHALIHLSPSIFAFVLSFTIILITWVNHHGFLKLVNKSSASFLFANGFLLLSIVFIPFPTALLGEFILTDHSVPAVMLFECTMAVQGLGWILVTGTAMKNQLTKDEKSAETMSENRKYGYFAVVLYSFCAIIAFWFPFSIAVITTFIWIYWLILAISLKHE
jgi:uncharacterized membrane protein